MDQVSTLVAHVIRHCLLAVTAGGASNSVTVASGTIGSPNSSSGGSGSIIALGSGSGYLCRHMKRDMKYILAFSSPRVGLHSCVAHHATSDC
jgi:hypothetical protein